MQSQEKGDVNLDDLISVDNLSFLFQNWPEAKEIKDTNSCMISDILHDGNPP